jgi:starvation-inducible outer membrane lipoprotein
MMKTRAPVGLLIGLVLLGSLPAGGRAEQGPLVPESFAQLRTNPQAYLGAAVELGGEIVRWMPSDQGFLLLVLQHPLAPTRRPDRLLSSGGWFWVEYPEQLGPLSPVAPLITLAGEVVGTKEGTPVIRARQVSLFSLLW